MQTSSLLVCLCLLGCSLAAGSVDFFAGRSAGIIVEPKQIPTQDSIVLLKGDQIGTTQLTTIQDTTFSDLFAHILGLPPFHVHVPRDGFPTTNLFNKPKATLIVGLDSVGSQTLNRYPSLSLLADAHTTTITSSSYPPSSISLLANLATGKTPSTHGIVGAAWRNVYTGELVSAYSAQGLSFSANIADVLLQSHSGKSLVVSASASASLSSVFAAHPELVSENFGWNAHAYSLAVTDDEEGKTHASFESRYAEASCDQVFAVSAEELAALVADVSVTVDGENVVTFTASEDLSLLAELAFVRNLIRQLKTNSLVTDKTPDLYSIVFSSLKDVEQKYGKTSVQFTAALKLVDDTVATLVAALNELYENRVAVAVIASHPVAFADDDTSAALKEKVHAKAARLLAQVEDFETLYPSLYIRQDELVGYALDLVCANLQEAVGHDAVVHCLASRLPIHARRGLLDATTNQTYNQTNSDYVWAFWLNFWVAIVLVVFVLWGAYCLVYVGIDASKDSLLFRATGRHLHQS